MASVSDSDSRIKIYFQGDQFLIWKAQDALKLRQKHRIVGSLIGPYPGEPYQVNKNGLPLQLMEEEVKLLLENQNADLIKIEIELNSDVVNSYNQHVEETRSQYSRLATERRLKEIDNHIASDSSKGLKRKREIMENKGLEGEISDNHSDSNDCEMKEKQKISIQTMNKNLLPVQLFTECPWPRKEEVINGKWLYPQKERDMLLYNIFKDLWNRGYYITSGFKYGCDYLAYEADPLAFHSKYMVSCQSQTDNLHGLQFLILNRVASQANKKLIIASLVDNDTDNCEPTYVSIDWQGNHDSPFKRSNIRPILPI